MFILSKIQKVEKLSPRLRGLYIHKVIRDVGVSLVGMFGPIFWYVLSGSLEFVLIYYGLICVIYVFVAPVWAKVLKYASMHIFMMIGVSGFVFYFIAWYFLAQAGSVIWYLVALMVFLAEVNRLFYWAPYHIDFTRFVNKHHKGRQMSFLGIVIALLGIVLPIISASIISNFGYGVLFIISVILIFISIFPALFIDHTREKYVFGYFETYKKFFSKNHIKTNLAYVADGFQGHIGAIVWPIFIFMLLKGEYLSVGLVSAAIILVSCVLRYVTGELSDKTRSKKKMIKLTSWLYSLGWIFKAVAATALHVFLVGVYHDFVGIFFRTPFDVLMYDIAADEGHYVDEFTILREIALNVGRILMVVFSLIILFYLNVVWVFVLGAFVSLLMNFVSKDEFRFSNQNAV